MSKEEPTTSDEAIAEFVNEHCPDLDEPGQRRAAANLRRYIEIVTRMAERIGNDAAKRNDDDAGNERPE